MKEEIDNKVKEIEAQLKDFQKASVDYVLDQFYVKGRNKILIADEVGLGKTIIAKGVVIKALEKEFNGQRPFHVVYICSNQVLAHQNLSKLNPFKSSANPLGRLLFLAFKDQDASSMHALKLSSLTPGTSFHLTRSVGYKEERAILYLLLSHYSRFGQYKKTLSKLLKATDQIGKENWNKLIKEYEARGADRIKKGLPKKLKDQLKIKRLDALRFPLVWQFLELKHDTSIWRGLLRLLAKLDEDKTTKPQNFGYEIVRALRFELTEVCLQYLQADLFILDEFQRFKSLIDGDDESEAGQLAKAILGKEDAKVLLLSATPFKPFTTQFDSLNGEDHFHEFEKLIKFLGGSQGEQLWHNLEQDRKAFFDILRHPKIAVTDPELAIDKKKSLEHSYRKLISRNERLLASPNYDDMVYQKKGEAITVIKEDIENFIAIDQLIAKVNELNLHKRNTISSPLEFSKSAPFPLSFLQGYKLRDAIEAHKNDPAFSKLLKQYPSAWLDFKKIQEYKPIGFYRNKPTYPNGKLRALAEECFQHNGEFLLWVPPTLSYYQPFGAYRKSHGFSKILVFSSWVMAPRAIATLLSYEVERRTIGAEDLKDLQEIKERKYFEMGKKRQRHPRPLLVYRVEKEQETPLNLTNFCITYPSIMLAGAVLQDYFNEEQPDYNSIKEQVCSYLNGLLEFEPLRKLQKSEGDSAKWYWFAPLLLDIYSGYKTDLRNLLNEMLQKGNSPVSQDDDQTSQLSGKKQHIEYLISCIDDVSNLNLGPMPEDLAPILADMALASPAVTALRSLKKIFATHDQLELLKSAASIAESFVTLFNKPESIAAVRMSAAGKFYWQQILNYCASGNIQSLLDEYLYLLYECENKRSPQELGELLRSVLSVRTSAINVDDKSTFLQGEPKKMRCHYAIDFGSQKIATDSGSNRMVNVREVFNSPFRPFVLASTSIGQEGLDFHYYCRKIFHWNLPHNAIDLEQREGRINRYKGLVIRKSLADTISRHKLITEKNPWSELFAVAEEASRESRVCEMVPFWHVDGGAKIERFVPIHLLSKDAVRYNQLKETLALYRLTFGQPRQEELVEALRSHGLTLEEINQLRKDLFINLSPLDSSQVSLEV